MWGTSFMLWTNRWVKINFHDMYIIYKLKGYLHLFVTRK